MLRQLTSLSSADKYQRYNRTVQQYYTSIRNFTVNRDHSYKKQGKKSGHLHLQIFQWVFSDHPFSLLFITMIPIDCKITNFFCLLFFIRSEHHFRRQNCFKRKNDKQNSFLAHPNVDQQKMCQPVHFVFTHFQPISQHYKQRKASIQSIQLLWKI